MQGTLTSTVAALVLCALAVGEGSSEVKAENNIVQAVNSFANRLYQELSGKTGNVFFSPISVDAVLAMTYAGAGGETARELAEVLGLPDKHRQVEAGYRALMSQLKDVNRNVTLEIANKIYVDATRPVLPKYRQSVKQNFRSEAEEVNFRRNPNGAVDAMNSWASAATHGKISEVFSPDSVKRDTLMVLLNAVYFKGDWVYKFDKESTKKEKFYIKPKTTQDTLMMYTFNIFRYTEDDDFQALKMYYKGKDTSMVILLPWEKDGLPKLEAKLPTLNWTDINGGLRIHDVHVKIPKFKLEETMDLNGPLMKLGIRSAFGKTADFSAITNRHVYIDNIAQKAFVDITEEGTEAAAVTYSETLVLPSMKPEPIWFVANHPFIFAIQEEKTGAILFLGRYSRPPP